MHKSPKKVLGENGKIGLFKYFKLKNILVMIYKKFISILIIFLFSCYSGTTFLSLTRISLMRFSLRKNPQMHKSLNAYIPKSLNAIIPNAPNDPQGVLQWIIQGAAAPCTPALGAIIRENPPWGKSCTLCTIREKRR